MCPTWTRCGFAAQSRVSGTNLAIVLSLLDATRETRRAEASVARGGEGVGKARRPRAGARSDAALLAALLSAALGGALEQTLAGLQAGGAPVAGPLACVAVPCALAVLALAGAAASDAGASAGADADAGVMMTSFLQPAGCRRCGAPVRRQTVGRR